MIGAPKLLSPGFTINETLIQFDLLTAQSDLINVSVSTDVEFLAFTTDSDTIYFLTEDLYYGRARQVSWNELWARTHNDNSDWYIKGLDTYSQYHSSTNSTPANQANSGNNNVYRLLNPGSGRYLFSSNNTEIDILTGLNWINEGITYKSPTTGGPTCIDTCWPMAQAIFTLLTTQKRKSWTIAIYLLMKEWHLKLCSCRRSTEPSPVARYFNKESGVHRIQPAHMSNPVRPLFNLINEGIAWYGEAV